MSGSDFTINHGDQREERRERRSVRSWSGLLSSGFEEFGQHVDAEVDGRIDAAATGCDRPMPSSRLAGSQPTIDDPLDRSSESGEHPEHDTRVHAVRVDDRRDVVTVGRAAAPDPARSRPACPAGSPIGIASMSTSDVVAVEQLVGEMDAADAEVGDPHPVRHGPARRGDWRPRRRSRRRRGRCCRCRRRARGGVMALPCRVRHVSGSTSSGWKKR